MKDTDGSWLTDGEPLGMSDMVGSELGDEDGMLLGADDLGAFVALGAFDALGA